MQTTTPPAAMERRNKQPAIPGELSRMLTPAQNYCLKQLENLGWQLAFVRRPASAEPIPVIVSIDRTRHAVIDVFGQVNHQPNIVIRSA